MEYFGTEEVSDEPARTINERLHRCYELAGYALTLGDAPEDAILVHGTWQHVVFSDKRRGHAWLVLPDDRVWEPIQGKIWNKREWELIVQPVEEVRYTKDEARNVIMFHRHWGRWHDSEYE